MTVTHASLFSGIGGAELAANGVSGRLSGISFPNWRKQSIKALGNSWVPQVAYEIFRAIQIEIDRDESNENKQRNPHRL